MLAVTESAFGQKSGGSHCLCTWSTYLFRMLSTSTSDHRPTTSAACTCWASSKRSSKSTASGMPIDWGLCQLARHRAHPAATEFQQRLALIAKTTCHFTLTSRNSVMSARRRRTLSARNALLVAHQLVYIRKTVSYCTTPSSVWETVVTLLAVYFTSLFSATVLLMHVAYRPVLFVFP